MITFANQIQNKFRNYIEHVNKNINHNDEQKEILKEISSKNKNYLIYAISEEDFSDIKDIIHRIVEKKIINLINKECNKDKDILIKSAHLKRNNEDNSFIKIRIINEQLQQDVYSFRMNMIVKKNLDKLQFDDYEGDIIKYKAKYYFKIKFYAVAFILSVVLFIAFLCLSFFISNLFASGMAIGTGFISMSVSQCRSSYDKYNNIQNVESNAKGKCNHEIETGSKKFYDFTIDELESELQIWHEIRDSLVKQIKNTSCEIYEQCIKDSHIEDAEAEMHKKFNERMNAMIV